MMTRTSTKTVTFNRPFTLSGLDEVLPAGIYTVETEEAALEGVSFLAYRRISTQLHVPGKSGSPVLARILTIDPQDLEAALERDRVLAPVRTDPDLGELLADPLVQLVMRSDGLTEYDVRRTLRR